MSLRPALLLCFLLVGCVRIETEGPDHVVTRTISTNPSRVDRVFLHVPNQEIVVIEEWARAGEIQIQALSEDDGLTIDSDFSGSNVNIYEKKKTEANAQDGVFEQITLKVPQGVSVEFQE